MNSKIKFFNEKYLYKESDIPNYEELLIKGICKKKKNLII